MNPMSKWVGKRWAGAVLLAALSTAACKDTRNTYAPPPP